MPRYLLIGVLVGLLASSGGCAASGLVVRSDRGTAPVELQRVRPVEYAREDLRHAVELYAEHLAAALRQREAQLRLSLASGPVAGPLHQAALVDPYLGWCARRGAPGDCLQVLDPRGPGLSIEAKRTIALRMALASGLQEAAEVVRNLNPVKVEATLVIWFTIYLGTLVFPDATVTKALFVVMTANLIAFLGVDGFRNIIQGWRAMAEEADAAQSFDQLRDAGERYGRRMGPSVLRIVTALITWGVGAATGMARPVTGNPGGVQAIANARAQGFHLAAVTGGSVSVSASGVVTLGLAAEAAMPDRGGGAHKPAKETPSIRSRLREAGLLGGSESTQVGPFRYRPPDDYRPGNPLPQADGGGYLDRFRNVWRKGPYHGDPSKPFTFEWDVQLSTAGRQHFKELGLGEKGYINVAPDGTLSH